MKNKNDTTSNKAGVGNISAFHHLTKSHFSSENFKKLLKCENW